MNDFDAPRTAQAGEGGDADAARLIYVCGTARSGSTVTDVMLGSSPDAFSCGEVYAWFQPWRPHHLELACSCGAERCGIWHRLSRRRSQTFHRAVVDEVGASVVVDSSKSLQWVLRTATPASRRGLDPAIVITWKDVRSLAYSYFKRLRTVESITAARDTFVTYHSRCFDIGLPMVAVRNADLKRDPAAVVQQLSTVLDIPYEDGQEEFWKAEHHYLFGSPTVRDQFARGGSSFDADDSAEFERHWTDLGYDDDPESAGVTARLEALDADNFDRFTDLPVGDGSLDLGRRPSWYYRLELARLKKHARLRLANPRRRRVH